MCGISHIYIGSLAEYQDPSYRRTIDLILRSR